MDAFDRDNLRTHLWSAIALIGQGDQEDALEALEMALGIVDNDQVVEESFYDSERPGVDLGASGGHCDGSVWWTDAEIAHCED